MVLINYNEWNYMYPSTYCKFLLYSKSVKQAILVSRLSKYRSNENTIYYKETRDAQKTIFQCVNTTVKILEACGSCKIEKTFNTFELGRSTLAF